MDVLLADHVRAAATGRDLVIFDLKEGRYDLLAGAGGVTAVDASGRRLRSDSLDLDVVLKPFATTPDRFTASPLLPPIPTRSALGGDVALATRGRIAFCSSWLDMSRTYYGRGLPSLLKRASNGAARRRCNRVEAQSLARTYHHLSPWAPFAGDCVFRSFMLLRALQARGVADVMWVFGVRTWPFYAHCWLQRGDETLTDHAEPLVSFTPIYVHAT